jgi:hypothetical protein
MVGPLVGQPLFLEPGVGYILPIEEGSPCTVGLGPSSLSSDTRSLASGCDILWLPSAQGFSLPPGLKSSSVALNLKEKILLPLSPAGLHTAGLRALLGHPQPPEYLANNPLASDSCLLDLLYCHKDFVRNEGGFLTSEVVEPSPELCSSLHAGPSTRPWKIPSRISQPTGSAPQFFPGQLSGALACPPAGSRVLTHPETRQPGSKIFQQTFLAFFSYILRGWCL